MPPPDGADTGVDNLNPLIRRQLDALGHRDDADVARLTAAICERFGNRVAAVLLYGSYLRGKRDTLLDFYVLLTDLGGAMPRLQAWGNRALPPNVYYLSLPEQEGRPALRAKYATLSLAQFETGMRAFHSYFWSRFTQPAGLVMVSDETTAARITGAIAAAVGRFGSEVAPMMEPRKDAPMDSPSFWRRGLGLTYGCELRSENPQGVGDLYAHHAEHFDALLAAYAGTRNAAVCADSDGRYRLSTAARVPQAAQRWRLRRAQGKVLSVLRLVKAAGTFDDPLDYLLWKIERHSGIYIEPSERQRRHPLVFSWPLLWRLYRRGAFR